MNFFYNASGDIVPRPYVYPPEEYYRQYPILFSASGNNKTATTTLYISVE